MVRMVSAQTAIAPRRDDDSVLDELCEIVFESLPRSDQRRWAAVYVNGLASIVGRKSIKKIALQATPQRCEQSLQQFVNQSPWDWAPVRRELMRYAESVVRPRAWIITEVEFAKGGNSSVGVAQQFSVNAGRTMNCQLALAAWSAGLQAAVPVNWRLIVPTEWDHDVDRRTKARLPDGEVNRSRVELVLDMVDEMTEAWDASPQPLLMDVRQDRNVDALVEGLERRGVRYGLRITERTPVVAGKRSGPPRTAAQILRAAPREMIAVPAYPDAHRSQPGRVATMAVVAQSVVAGAPADPIRRPRRVVARWTRRREQSCELWLTNLPAARIPELFQDLDMVYRPAVELVSLRAESGLDHFEGRSFRGWHHHVTLASIAHAVQVARRRVGRDRLSM